MKKQYVLKVLNEMPNDFELENLIEKLIFIEKVEKGISQLHSGNTVTHNEVKQKIKGWDLRKKHLH